MRSARSKLRYIWCSPREPDLVGGGTEAGVIAPASPARGDRVAAASIAGVDLATLPGGDFAIVVVVIGSAVFESAWRTDVG